MLEIRGIWLCHMSRWDRYVLRPRIWRETSRSRTVPHIGPYIHNRGSGYSDSFVNPAGVYRFTHMIISYRLCTRHRSRGAGEDAHHNCYLIADLDHESRLPRLVSTIRNPAGLPKWTQTMCAWCENRSRMSCSLTLIPGHKLTRN